MTDLEHRARELAGFPSGDGGGRTVSKNDLPPKLLCAMPDTPCECAPGCCENATIELTKCAKCGAEAAIFICSTPGCPVNGGAAYDAWAGEGGR